ncbi:MAG: amino acid ABC transporter [Proteobacteria bacterium]|nr:MAG: amino acid ABC transporter [Pseudomonadota bacterium]
MKKTWLMALALGAALVSGTAVAEGTLRIGTEGAYAPYNFLNDDGKVAGFEIDLGNALCEQLAMECKFVLNEWDSIIPNLLAGNYDLIMAGMSITDERKKTLAFSDEYKPVDPSLYLVVKGTELDFGNLEGKSVGVQGATLQAAFAEEKFGEKNTIKSYEKSDQFVSDLAAGNVDVVLADGEFIRAMAEGSQGLLEITGPEEQIGGGIAVGLRQDDAELLEKLNAALDTLKENGELDQLLEKYFKMKSVYSTEEAKK